MQGAQRFAADCQALQEGFRRWTPRPGAHFRELAEACAMLCMQPAAAADLLRGLQSQSADERGSCPALTALQVRLCCFLAGPYERASSFWAWAVELAESRGLAAGLQQHLDEADAEVQQRRKVAWQTS